ncbi:unnamed protein product [Tuber melanosporum]|uniref:Mitochondrial glycine transporter n=1 Tax=Tuber melanosporum (strain Mel28) TaxID=656061 RepID=D5GA11_TUBMM|nr:uncharacterized protein GSTUM_00003488001 [Tuber melanosporum]CAZ81354.1 unnamed protein product [Tuber melanosporum]
MTATTTAAATIATTQVISKPPRKNHFLSGGFSGVLSAILLQPADLLKTRLQQSPPTTSATRTLLRTLQQIASSPRPIRSLWRGTLPSAIRTGVGSALYFSALNTIRSGLSSRSSTTASSSLPTLSPLGNLASGAGTRAVVGYLMMPVTILKVRYESSLYTYPTFSSACQDIYKTEGMRGFFSGWGATAIRDAPYAGLYVVFYEQSKKTLSRFWHTKEGGGMDVGTAAGINVLSGAGAATLATAITNPFDALKTRIQVSPGRYRNLWHAAKVVVKEDGRWKGRALFDGLGLRIARKAVSSAVVWGIYEGLVR